MTPRLVVLSISSNKSIIEAILFTSESPFFEKAVATLYLTYIFKYITAQESVKCLRNIHEPFLVWSKGTWIFWRIMNHSLELERYCMSSCLVFWEEDTESLGRDWNIRMYLDIYCRIYIWLFFREIELGDTGKKSIVFVGWIEMRRCWRPEGVSNIKRCSDICCGIYMKLFWRELSWGDTEINFHFNTFGRRRGVRNINWCLDICYRVYMWLFWRELSRGCTVKILGLWEDQLRGEGGTGRSVIVWNIKQSLDICDKLYMQLFCRRIELGRHRDRFTL